MRQTTPRPVTGLAHIARFASTAVIAVCVLFGSTTSAQAGHNGVSITSTQGHAPATVVVRKDGTVTANRRKVDVTVKCQKSGYRVWKVGSKTFKTDRSTRTVTGVEARITNLSDTRKYAALRACIAQHKTGKKTPLSLSYQVTAQCKKVKIPSKGKVDTVKTHKFLGTRLDCGPLLRAL